MSVGSKIRMLRDIQKLSQKKLAVMSNLAQPTIARYELDLVSPSNNNAITIAKALNVDIEYLLNEERND